MAKAGFAISFTPYSRRDPVSGATKTFVRSSHSRQSSAKLKAFQRCVADAMRGKTASGGTPKERAASIRSSLSSAAKGCKK